MIGFAHRVRRDPDRSGGTLIHVTPDLLVALVGLGILIASLLLDGEGFDAFDGWLSGTVIGAALAVLGFTAMLIPDGSLTGGVSWLVAGGAAVAAAFAVRAGVRGLSRVGQHEPARIDELRGAIATVTSDIPASGPGQVAAVLRGVPVRLSAVSDGPVRRGAQVLVVDVLSPTQVRVVATDPALPPA